MGSLVGIVLFQIAYSNPEYSNVISSLPQDLRSKVPTNIKLLTDASDYNLSVKLYRGTSTNEDVLVLLLQNKISEPILVNFARINLIENIAKDSQQFTDYQMVGDLGERTPQSTRLTTPYHGKLQEIQPKGSLAAVLIGSLNVDLLNAEVLYCLKSEGDSIVEGFYCKQSEMTEYQFVSYSVVTPAYDLKMKSVSMMDEINGYPSLTIGSYSSFHIDKAYMYVYTSDAAVKGDTPRIREEIVTTVRGSGNDIIIYQATASQRASIWGFFYHMPMVQVRGNLPQDPLANYIIVILKDKPDDKTLAQIGELMEANNYTFRGSGEGMNIRID